MNFVTHKNSKRGEPAEVGAHVRQGFEPRTVDECRLLPRAPALAIPTSELA